MKRLGVLVLVTSFASGTAIAGDFDGSSPLICAPVLAMDCAEGVACASGMPAEMGAPAFIRVDVARKEVTGKERTSPVLQIQRTEGQLLLQGVELGQAWAIAIDGTSGRMHATLTGNGGAVVMIGSCTPL